MTQEEIIKYAEGLSHASDAVYSEHDAEVLAQYKGCADSEYSETFTDKVWKALIEEVYSKYDSYTSINVFSPSCIGASLLKKAPKNSNIYNLNGETIPYLTAKSNLTGFDWLPNVEFGSVANYFYLSYPIEDGEEVVTSNKYHIILIAYESDNQYYKAIDCDNGLTELPYYQYLLARCSKLICTSDKICLYLPNAKIEEFKNFNLSKYGLEITKEIKDLSHKAYIITKS